MNSCSGGTSGTFAVAATAVGRLLTKNIKNANNANLLVGVLNIFVQQKVFATRFTIGELIFTASVNDYPQEFTQIFTKKLPELIHKKL